MKACSGWSQLRRAAVVFAAVAALVGCEATPQGASSASHADVQARWQAHASWLAGIDRWRTSGRVAVQVPDDGWSAALRWQQLGPDYRIQLNGPFGQGAVRIDGTADEVVLRTADGQVLRADSAEQLVATQLNADVPISLLRFWVLGRPAPDVAVQTLQLDELGHVQQLRQAGWLVTYQDYEAHGVSALPTRLQIEQGTTQARFALGAWRTDL